ncbi:MAG TPA: sodium-dependent transporter [Gemmatimonadota bacterium]|nr:sodium-dependent transporter [Gemmatimonadota bacterium]
METTARPVRGQWGSKLAFILASAGSAIGLGNIWGFPTLASANGGAAFVVVYLLAVAFIGAPVMLAEFVIGRRTGRNPVGAFRALAPRSAWVAVGGMGVLAGVMILSFYSVVAGWTLAYIVKAASGAFVAGADTSAIFASVAGSAPVAVGWHLAFMVLTVLVVIGGVKNGIERWTKVLMPGLFGILLLLVARSVTLSGAGPGLEFYLRPDFGRLDGGVVLAAIGQAFFSLSLGMGAMITYGSYMTKDDDLETSAGWVVSLDTSVALLAGLVIFPTLFHAGMEPGAGGPGMVFVVLTSLLSTIPPEPWGGTVFGVLFFVLLMVAALTSSISLLEVATAWLVDEKGVSRKKASIGIATLAFLIGIPSALANGAVPWLSSLPGIGMDFLSFLFMLFGQYALVVGALLISVFTAWVWGVENAADEVRSNDGEFSLEGTWSFLIRFLCPIAIVTLLVYLLWQQLGA